ncbi:MAG: sigma 54-interacting transcriptional regulator [Desulfotignum sp.]|nr:sigma 54-interacting transcriptional regulator [Desulfotignum sp.]MCF8089812.1 sigma 54-interacting transcriptional regulator [Desulfotignum sp.]MCF8138894.1 sigma 54-interacting transcriptional regulator [Desulfotignum sp.]
MNTIEALKEKLALYERIFDNINAGVLIIDAHGYITHFNEPYGRFLNLAPREQIGRHCTDVIENTRMHIVAQTGKAEINHSQRINGQDMVVQRIPIKKDKKVIAVYGQVMFKDVAEVRDLADQLSLLKSKVQLFEKELFDLRATRYTFDCIIGDSDAITGLKQEAAKAATTHSSVLVTGESGTGKELFAQAIHNAGPRKRHPFVKINCAAIPRDLLESELFGYEKGAFTGAGAKGKPGKFELAGKGTIFLDEIGDLPLEMQPKLLRVLEEKAFERIGGNRVIRSDFRVICATNRDLAEMMGKNRFRRDLFYRLNVIPIHIPPLRERPEDILPLARHMLKRIAKEAGRPAMRIEKKAARDLMRYSWPGNARELSNVLERAMYASGSGTICPADLPFTPASGRQVSGRRSKPSLKSARDEAQITAIHQALAQTGYNKAGAARLLGIHRTLLYKKMKKFGIRLTQDQAPDKI